MANNPFAGTTPASYTPGILAHFQGGMTGQDDGSWQDYQRTQGDYAPGSMETVTDKIEQGSDEQA